MEILRQSKGLGVLAILLASLATVCQTSALATPGITLLDGQHHISGKARIGGAPPTTDSYDHASAYDAIGGLPALYDSAQADSSAQAESWASVFSLRVETDAWNGGAEAHADAMWLFEPKWSTLELCFNCFLYGTDPTFAELIDQTTGTTVYSWDSPWGPPDFEWSGTTMAFGVDPAHVYSLQASLYAASHDDGSFYSSMNAAVVPVPSALLLGVFGAALVGRWHRHSTV